MGFGCICEKCLEKARTLMKKKQLELDKVGDLLTVPAPPEELLEEPPEFPSSLKKSDGLKWNQRLGNRLALWRKKSAKVHIEMNYANGSIKEFVVVTKGRIFRHGGMPYVIDGMSYRWHVGMKLPHYRYMQGFAMPIQWTVNEKKLQDAVPEGYLDITSCFNPSVLKEVLKFEMAKAVLKGAEIAEVIKRAFIISFIILLVAIVHFVVEGAKSGWFSSA